MSFIGDRKMAKAIALYKGGTNVEIEHAVREDGTVYKRYRRMTSYGLKWTAWTSTGRHIEVTPEFAPQPVISTGVATLSLVSQQSRLKSHRSMFGAGGELKIRLPSA